MFELSGLYNMMSLESRENDYHGLGMLSGGRDLAESILLGHSDR